MSDMNSSRDMLKQCDAVLRQQLAPLYVYLENPEVQEVMVNSPSNIFIERLGKLEKVDLEISNDSIKSAIVVLANINDKSSSKSPIIDCRLPGLRIAATLPPVAVHGAAMCIRRHSSQTFTLESYVERGSFNPTVDVSRKVGSSNRPSDETVGRGREGLAEFLKWMVQSKCNFIVSGSTSSGKTALLNALAAYIPADDRVLTIEDTAELKMKVLNWLAFEANQTYGVDIRALVRHALRNRPDRIWVGEIRGAEACDMLDAYNTGHPGSTVSYHSDTAALALSRLESMVRKAPEAANWPLEDLRRQIASTFKFVVHASKLEGQRGPSEVIEITGIENGQYITRSIFKKQIIYTN